MSTIIDHGRGRSIRPGRPVDLDRAGCMIFPQSIQNTPTFVEFEKCAPAAPPPEDGGAAAAGVTGGGGGRWWRQWLFGLVHWDATRLAVRGDAALLAGGGGTGRGERCAGVCGTERRSQAARGAVRGWWRHGAGCRVGVVHTRQPARRGGASPGAVCVQHARAAAARNARPLQQHGRSSAAMCAFSYYVAFAHPSTEPSLGRADSDHWSHGYAPRVCLRCAHLMLRLHPGTYPRWSPCADHGCSVDQTEATTAMRHAHWRADERTRSVLPNGALVWASDDGIAQFELPHHKRFFRITLPVAVPQELQTRIPGSSNLIPALRSDWISSTGFYMKTVVQTHLCNECPTRWRELLLAACAMPSRGEWTVELPSVVETVSQMFALALEVSLQTNRVFYGFRSSALCRVPIRCQSIPQRCRDF